MLRALRLPRGLRPERRAAERRDVFKVFRQYRRDYCSSHGRMTAVGDDDEWCSCVVAGAAAPAASFGSAGQVSSQRTSTHRSSRT